MERDDRSPEERRQSLSRPSKEIQDKIVQRLQSRRDRRRRNRRNDK